MGVWGYKPRWGNAGAKLGAICARGVCKGPRQELSSPAPLKGNCQLSSILEPKAGKTQTFHSLKAWALTVHVGQTLPAPIKVALTSIIFLFFFHRPHGNPLRVLGRDRSLCLESVAKGSGPEQPGCAGPSSPDSSLWIKRRRVLINLSSNFLPRTILIINPVCLTINSIDLMLNHRV